MTRLFPRDDDRESFRGGGSVDVFRGGVIEAELVPDGVADDTLITSFRFKVTSTVQSGRDISH
jgi:hypothetical protein